MTTVWILVVIWTADTEPTYRPEWTARFTSILACETAQRKADNPPNRRAVCIAGN